jgi:uncharacterized protein YbjT (DUF2867 family)
MVQGDLEQKDTLPPVVEGIDAVFCVTNFWTAGYDRQVEQATNIADVSAEAGVDHFVFSGVGSHDQDTGLAHFDSAWEIDRHIQELGLPNTILKPVFFFQNLEVMSDDILGGTLAMPLEEGVSLQMIDITDIGRATADVIEAPDQFIGKRIDLAGDEKTLDEMAAAFTEVIGAPVEPIHVPVAQAREQLGDEMTDMFDWFNEVGYSADIEALESTFSFSFTDLEAYLEAAGWAERS